MNLVSHIGHFREAVAHQLGLWFDDSKGVFLAEVLERRLAAAPASAATYVQQLERGVLRPAEQRELARELTVSETFFFRHYDQFRAFAEVALPDRVAARAASRELHILSAGC